MDMQPQYVIECCKYCYTMTDLIDQKLQLITYFGNKMSPQHFNFALFQLGKKSTKPAYVQRPKSQLQIHQQIVNDRLAILASFLTVLVEVFATSCLVCTHLSAFQLQALIPGNIRVDDLDFHVLLLRPIMIKLILLGYVLLTFENIF